MVGGSDEIRNHALSAEEDRFDQGCLVLPKGVVSARNKKSLPAKGRGAPGIALVFL